MMKVAVIGNPSSGKTALTDIATTHKETIIIDKNMQDKKEQAARNLDKKLADQHDRHQSEYEKEAARMEREDRRALIEKLDGIDLDTDQPYSYQEFKVQMAYRFKCKFERSYLRSLYRKYKVRYQGTAK